ncbi:dihydroxyacetone kinase subunit DhaL [Virgisporangium aurantiacum]|uniref:Dihydroxyacetone kinase subunit L n=1 Tax=Virgisporangium aurantiacum TaxID=175570 RepID=A0A8J3ZFQ9_9ACTN|nr:dihydroxyacetone kinase subunit DhaL [Virgisporangium aurantiacum]GIJ60518.1 dihydroxyacetone kinase subunit L [Virgisporangium aurantiacum]
MNFDADAARAWVVAAAAAVTENADHLTQLDSAIGDADHGVNLKRGFTAVTAALDGFAADGPGAVLVKTGTTLISKVGGASGPLYGSAFRAIGKALDGPEADAAALGAALRDGLAAIRKLGAAAPGDKTMVDALDPAVEAFVAAAPDGLGPAAEAAAQAAEAGAKATAELQARKGRASYLGARSVGHQDPGATSTALILRALATVLD